MKLSLQQSNAIDAVSRWYKTPVQSRKPFFYLGGYAGTGKTTLATYFAQLINGETIYGAYTGKAAMVMRKKGCYGASTIHSMIYIPEVDKKTGEVRFKYNVGSPLGKAALIIIDECSMVDEKIGKDVLSFGVPVLVLGDPAQLPPVQGAGYFTNGEPDFMLTEIHRQAAENPIVYLATKIRNQETLELGEYGGSKVTNKFLKDEVFGADQLLCGLNNTRIGMNGRFRNHLGFETPMPQKEETLICLKNNRDMAIFNGEMFKVMETPVDKGGYLQLPIQSIDTENAKLIKPRVLKYHFDPANFREPEDWKMKVGYQELTYGYALTTHKSQGSQWDNVYVINEADVFRDMWWRWLYTAITRAAEDVIVYQ